MSTHAPLALASELARKWWIILLRGILLIIVGLYALFAPGVTLTAYCFVLGAFLAADGVLAVIAGIAGWTDSRIGMIIRGIIAILIGLAVMAWPSLFGAVAVLTLVILIAGGLIVSGALEIVSAIRERKAIQGEAWLILHGIISVLFGIVLVIVPFVAMKALIMVTGIFAIIFGCVTIAIAFKIKSLGSKLRAAGLNEDGKAPVAS